MLYCLFTFIAQEVYTFNHMSTYNIIPNQENSSKESSSPESILKTPGQELKEIIIEINDKEDLLDKIKDDIIKARQNLEGIPDDQVAGKLKALNAIRDETFNEITILQLRQAKLQGELDTKYISTNPDEEIPYKKPEDDEVLVAKPSDKVTHSPEDAIAWDDNYTDGSDEKRGIRSV